MVCQILSKKCIGSQIKVRFLLHMTKTRLCIMTFDEIESYLIDLVGKNIFILFGQFHTKTASVIYVVGFKLQ